MNGSCRTITKTNKFSRQMDSIEIRRLEDFKDTNRPSAAAISQCDFSQRVKAAAIIGAANRRPSVSWLVATTCMDLTCAR